MELGWLQLSPRRWSAVHPRLGRSIGFVRQRGDGLFEWQVGGKLGVAATREVAGEDLVAANGLVELADNAPPFGEPAVAPHARRCAWCADPLPATATARRVYCSDGCRLEAFRERHATDERAIRVREPGARRTLTRVERAAARARARFVS